MSHTFSRRNKLYNLINNLFHILVSPSRWSFLAPMTQCRSGHGVAVLGDLMYAVGGHDGVQYLNTVETFDTQLGEWISQGPMGTCRAVAGVAVLNNIPCTNV